MKILFNTFNNNYTKNTSFKAGKTSRSQKDSIIEYTDEFIKTSKEFGQEQNPIDLKLDFCIRELYKLKAALGQTDNINGDLICDEDNWYIIENNEQSPFAPESIRNIKKINGNVILKNSNSIKTLRGIQKIAGNLNIENCPYLTNIKDVLSVGGDLTIKDCPDFNNFGDLEFIGGSLYEQGIDTNTSLGSLLSVCGNIFSESISDTGNLKYLGGDLNMKNISSLGQLYSIKGSLNIYTKLNDFGELENCGCISFKDNQDINPPKNLTNVKFYINYNTPQQKEALKDVKIWQFNQ